MNEISLPFLKAVNLILANRVHTNRHDSLSAVGKGDIQMTWYFKWINARVEVRKVEWLIVHGYADQSIV